MLLRSFIPAAVDRAPVRIDDINVETLTLEETADAFVAYCRSQHRARADRPLLSTSVNGQVLSLCDADAEVAAKFAAFDSVSVDGQPLVMMSRLLARSAFPERVATTDLFPLVARRAAAERLSFYILGGSARANARAVAAAHRDFPGLNFVGSRDGYFRRDEEAGVTAVIAALKPDILWVSLGAPLEQDFCLRNASALRGVGIVKTSGGLVDFIAGDKPRAPAWMQKIGLEWAFRLAKEPRRLFLRYALTNPHAMLVMMRAMR